MADAVKRNNTTLEDLEQFIDRTYNRTINMNSAGNRQTLMELLMSPAPNDSSRATSTPLQQTYKYRTETQNMDDNISVVQDVQDNKRKASTSLHLNDSGDSSIDTSMKEYLDNMTSSITRANYDV